MIVVDASVVVDLVLGGHSEGGESLASYFRAGDHVCVPYLVDAEVGQALRRFSLRGEIDDSTVATQLADFLDLPIRRYPHGGLLLRAFELRANVTIYDALYLALAEALDCRFLTGDAALADVPHCRAVVEVVATTA